MSLEAINVSKSFKKRQVVKSVSFHINPGEIVGILGPNGAGKTTSFYMMVGLLSPCEGTVKLDDIDVTRVPMHQRSRLGIGYLPQSASIFKKLTVKQNLTAIMQIAKVPRAERRQLLDRLISQFGLGKVVSSLGASLSGGERRRVEIARTLISKPKYLLLDEPFAAIDPVTVQEVQAIIKNLCEVEGLGILITDHNVRETLSSCQRAYILAEGEMIASGAPLDIAKVPEVKSKYLGQDFSF